MKLNIFKTQEELIAEMAAYFIKSANAAIEEKGAFDVSLVGGNSPKKLYELLATKEFKNQTDWHKINFFFGDERYVPANDPQSNALMVQNVLFTPLKISEKQIFKIIEAQSIASLPTPDAAAKKYNETIVTHFKNKPVRFDLMLLGLGDNSHTASLFPFTPVLFESSATVKAVFLKDQNIYRITMTAPMINQSKQIAFLVYGKEKAEAVYHILKDVQDIEKYPAQLIHPTEGELEWFLDTDAASLLEN